ncbi:MAG: type II CRISPR RNA-guided endonuclease Cas9 [Lactobacillus crispatus]|nr:type II CRISPR RNA-guided endonuclease Cas9 [Lactobacillus crispatus]
MTLDNAYVPYQLNAIVVNKILANQGKHYSFLVEPNPALPDRKEAPYKISQLMQFTIPYYVGPLATPAEQKNLPEGSKFAWLVRKEKGKITPWNFYDKVDVMATADAFIKRAIGKDTYLLSEPVLPQNSLLYQKYTVLNELSNISLVDANTKKVNKLNANVKQLLYRECFKKKVTVTKQFAMKVLNDHNIPVSDIEGLSDGKKFTSALTTFNSWKKHFPEEIDNPHFAQDFENMIEWSTVFEDRKILADKLRQEIDWLTNEQFKFIVESRLTGWGRFSKKLLVGLKDAKGKSVLDNLYNTKKNFNQIIARADFRTQIDEIAYRTTQNQSLDDILDAMYASPANRKAIHQTLRVVEEVVSWAKSAPDKIFVTFQRSKEQEGKLIDNRATQLLKIYRGIKDKDPWVDSDLIDQLSQAVYAKDPRDKLNNKRYLYFQQLGRDALTGEIIDPSKINEYSVLHIIPRSKIIDDSINNLILTKIKSHSDSIMKEFGSNKILREKMTIKEFWNKLYNLGLLSKAKLNNLELDLGSLNKYQRKGYIARQLVETNQVTKAIAMILQTKYPHSKIIEVRHDQIANVRYCFDLYRIKNLNTYYRAMDAYIAAVVGTYVYTVYPKARRFFVYGEYLKPKVKPNQDFNTKETGHGFNFLWRLLYGKEDEVYVQGTNNIAFSRAEIIAKLKQVYNFKYQNISIATATKRANMFNQTLYPRHERDVQKTRTLIRKKKNLDTDIYGGYTGNVNSFFVLVQTKRKNKPDKFNLYGVPRRFLDVLEASKSTGNYEQKLHEIVDPIVKSNNNKMTSYRIIKDKVPYYQAILDEGSKFCITSDQYRYNCRQLILSQEAQKSLMDYVVDPNFYQHKKTKDVVFDKDTKLVKVYDEILHQVDTYLPLYTIRSISTKLKKAHSAFEKCSLKDKAYVLDRLLTSISSNPTMPDLKPIGLTPLTLIKKNCPLTENAVFIYTSPTGMKSKKVSIKQMIEKFKN